MNYIVNVTQRNMHEKFYINKQSEHPRKKILSDI